MGSGLENYDLGACLVNDIPEAPDSLTITSDTTSVFVTLEWVNPVRTVQGNPLDTLDCIHIWRNGEHIVELRGPQLVGQAYIDQLPRPDYYRYQVCAEDTSGQMGRQVYTAEMWLGGAISGILVWDLDHTPVTGAAIQEGLNSLGYPGYVYVSPTSVRYPLESSLDAVFVCLGVYSNNHVLTDEEGDRLQNYLNTGGNLYMEGGDTWCYDPQTTVHPYFQIQQIGDGYNDLTSVQGSPGTPFENYLFAYNGENNYIDDIAATPSSLEIFYNPADNQGTAVVYDAGGYKSIGSSFEFGGLTDGSAPSTRQNLLRSYLQFFGIIPTGIPPQEGDESLPLAFALHQNYPNPFNPTTVISWQIPGPAQGRDGQLPVSSSVRLSLYNVAGQRVAVLVDESQPAGFHSIEFDASHLASGVYYYRLEAGDPVTGSEQGYTESRKMVLMR